MSVIGLGAYCDFDGDGTPGPGISYAVSEFAVLADGSRVTLLEGERGLSSWIRDQDDPRGALDQWAYTTLADLESGVRTTVLPDDDGEDEHPWEWLVSLLAARGVQASVDGLRAVPYVVEFSDRLRARLG